jgi:hypothetical protein
VVNEVILAQEKLVHVSERHWRAGWVATGYPDFRAAAIGRRSAYARLSHLICEFVARTKAAGISDGKNCDFPLTQTELGDALGLSTVPVNRTLKKLHQDGLITWHSHSLTVRDWERLTEVADFDDDYLELRRSGARANQSSGGQKQGR